MIIGDTNGSYYTDTERGITTYQMAGLVAQAKRNVRADAKVAGKKAQFLDCFVEVTNEGKTILLARGYIPAEQRSFEVRELL